jgi:hypothetical protein
VSVPFSIRAVRLSIETISPEDNHCPSLSRLSTRLGSGQKKFENLGKKRAGSEKTAPNMRARHPLDDRGSLGNTAAQRVNAEPDAERHDRLVPTPQQETKSQLPQAKARALDRSADDPGGHGRAEEKGARDWVVNEERKMLNGVG